MKALRKPRLHNQTHRANACRRFVARLTGLSASVALLLLPAASLFAQSAVSPGQASAAKQEKQAGAALVPGFKLPAQPTKTMPVSEVRIGMKGYGLTVFHGVKVEPFEVEVVSIQSDFNPDSAVIWVRSQDPRMQFSGPVAGMSGSPIYLWEEGQQGTLGQAGRLVGAFAFGFALSKDCYVGVQPIDYMRRAGRLGLESTKDGKAQASQNASPADAAQYRKLIASLAGNAKSPREAARLAMFQKLADHRMTPGFSGKPGAPGTGAIGTGHALTQTPASPGPLVNLPGFESPRQARRLSLPVDVGSPQAAQLFGPLLESMGLSAMSAGAVNITSGQTPAGINAEAIALEPGSALSVPLAWGDQTLAAIGTVTDVLPDASVLGFGHPMFGEGVTRLPMATGFIHFIQPNLQVSFKHAGSAIIRGSLVYDDQSAVVGLPEQNFKTTPVKVTVKLPGRPEARFNFQTIQHKKLGPMLPVMLLLNSVRSLQNLPLENTARLRATLDYGAGRVIKVDSLMPMASPMGFAMQVYPAMAFLALNPLESMTLQSADFELDVQDTVRAAFIASAKAVREEIKPGEMLEVAVKLKPFGKPEEERRLAIRVPGDMPDGTYQATVCDAESFLMASIFNKPYLSRTTNGDELFELASRIMGVRSDRVYIMLDLPQAVLSVNRQELPRLPGSKASLIASQSSSAVGYSNEMISREYTENLYIEGAVSVQFRVRKEGPGK